jgi:hypothetical protein
VANAAQRDHMVPGGAAGRPVPTPGGHLGREQNLRLFLVLLVSSGGVGPATVSEENIIIMFNRIESYYLYRICRCPFFVYSVLPYYVCI